MDGAAAAGIADLAEQFPAQIIDPEVHKLLEEGPGRRRRFLDWGVFHVEHRFLPNWRRYHQALRQRNAALKQEAGDDDLAAWEQELGASGEVARHTARCLSRRAFRHPWPPSAYRIAGQADPLVHHRGWNADAAAAGGVGAGSPARSPLQGDPNWARTEATSSFRSRIGQPRITSRADSKSWWQPG